MATTRGLLMATIVPISGKNGKLTWASNVLYLSKWDAEVKIDIEEYSHFGQSPDSQSLIFKGLIDGFASGTANVEGKFDNTVGSYLPSSKTVWPQVTGTLYLGYNATIGLTCTGIVESVKTGQGTDSSAVYAATFRITAMAFTTS